MLEALCRTKTKRWVMLVGIYCLSVLSFTRATGAIDDWQNWYGAR
jgi:hypothetical protein